MKCLSISQPFADLIISGKKTIELRSWNTNFRGEFLVHSPIKIRAEDCKRLKITKKLETGVIVGKAEIYDVKQYRNNSEIKEDKPFHFSSKNFQKKMYGFMLKNGKSLRVPIRWKGQLGFFEVEIQKDNNSHENLISGIIDEEYRYQWIGHH